jgi:hypothetical protein
MLALLVALSLLALIAAVALCPYDPGRGRAEQATEIGLVWVGLVVGPIYLLGMANVLTRASLASLAVAADAASIALGLRFAGARRRSVREAARDLGRVLRLPYDALAVTARARSMSFLGVLLFYGFFAWTIAQAYLAPHWRDWDELWYHEPMIGFAIQNHGFAMTPLPMGLQTINGFQKLAEMTQLWFGIFAGRRLVDIANVVTCPLLLAAMAALARRYRVDAAGAVGWAVALAFMPGNARLLQSTMVDPEAAALLLAAAYFVTRPEITLRSAIFAVLAMTLAVGSKTFFLFPVGLFCLVFAVRLLLHRRALGGWRTTSLVLVLGGASVLGMVAFTHLRNWIHFGNPFWPVLSYDNAALGIHWKGWFPLWHKGQDLRSGVDGTLPFGSFVERMLARPYTVKDGHTWQVVDYGYAIAWVIIPLGAVATFAALVAFIVKLIRRQRDEGRRLVASALVLGIVALLSMKASPALYIGRYHIATVGMLIAVLTWVSGRPGWQRMGDGAAFFAQIGAVTMIAWASPRWIADPATMMKLAAAPPVLRQCSSLLGAPTWTDTCLAREREIGAGTVVAYDDLEYVALLFNGAYSNRVEWIGDNPPNPLAVAESLGAQWVYTKAGHPMYGELMQSKRWTLIGPLEAERFGMVFRRSAP